jgi:hypothetical protein
MLWVCVQLSGSFEQLLLFLELTLHVSDHRADLIHRLLDLILADAEVFRPVVQLVVFARVNAVSVALANFGFVVSHTSPLFDMIT